jgi:trans-2,3-dihydro-3-hydroxyanthranilate isomerase
MFVASTAGEKTMRRFHYKLLDVFTKDPLAGNQLAVFTDARGLTDEEMQQLAKETNLSETTFIFPREKDVEAKSGVKVRIFTVGEELEFAGHPTLGTANVLRAKGQKQVDLDLRVGKIPVTFEDSDNTSGLPFGEMTQRDPKFGAKHQREDIAPLGGLRAEELRNDFPIQTVSTGMAFMIVPVKSPDSMHKLQYNAALAQKYLENSDAKFIFWVCPNEKRSPRLNARMFFYNGEDPATGSASGCATAWMRQYDIISDNERVLISQGVEMKRPSEIFVRAEKHDDKVTNVRVGGHVVRVGEGEFIVP